ANSPFRLPQNTWVNCARSSGALPPPSPPAWLVQSSLVNSLSVYFLDKARRAVTLHLPTSDNSRSGDPYQIRQRIKARSEIVTHWPMIITARPPSLSFMGHPIVIFGEAVISADRARRFIHFEERPLDRRLRQSVPLQHLIIEPHQHFELCKRCLPKVLV